MTVDVFCDRYHSASPSAGVFFLPASRLPIRDDATATGPLVGLHPNQRPFSLIGLASNGKTQGSVRDFISRISKHLGSGKNAKSNSAWLHFASNGTRPTVHCSCGTSVSLARDLRSNLLIMVPRTTGSGSCVYGSYHGGRGALGYSLCADNRARCGICCCSNCP
jgi:hypothetical protein